MNQTYRLYTDASRRYHNGEMLCVIAGCLLDKHNAPVLEFIIQTAPLGNTEYLEMLALKTGLEEAKRAGVKNIACFVDNLNTVKILKRLQRYGQTEVKQQGWPEILIKFDSFNLEYIPRKYNLYANALSKVPFNIMVKGDAKKAYHGINRSKRRFYEQHEEGLSEDIHDYQAKNEASVYIKFKQTRDTLEFLSQKEQKTLLDMKRIEKLFKQFYTYFHTVLYARKDEKIKEQYPHAFYDFLQTTRIDSQYWPQWLSHPPTKKRHI